MKMTTGAKIRALPRLKVSEIMDTSTPIDIPTVSDAAELKSPFSVSVRVPWHADAIECNAVDLLSEATRFGTLGKIAATKTVHGGDFVAELMGSDRFGSRIGVQRSAGSDLTEIMALDGDGNSRFQFGARIGLASPEFRAAAASLRRIGNKMLAVSFQPAGVKFYAGFMQARVKVVELRRELEALRAQLETADTPKERQAIERKIATREKRSPIVFARFEAKREAYATELEAAAEKMRRLRSEVADLLTSLPEDPLAWSALVRPTSRPQRSILDDDAIQYRERPLCEAEANTDYPAHTSSEAAALA